MRCRDTTQSTPMASIVLAVSTIVSPLETLLPVLLNSTVSAPRRFAAREKLFRVRVLFSKNIFAHVLPVSNDNLLRQPAVACFIQLAISSITFSSSADKLSRSNRFRRRHGRGGGSADRRGSVEEIVGTTSTLSIFGIGMGVDFQQNNRFYFIPPRSLSISRNVCGIGTVVFARKTFAFGGK